MSLGDYSIDHWTC